MSELIKKQSYSIDMKPSTKENLTNISRQIRLPQGDTIQFLIDYYEKHDINSQAQDNALLMKTMIGQQNQLIAMLSEQNALLLRLSK